ncbi:tetratricopeptide repeat protein [Segetibacter koreensis]|uniref:tetratricopeptide repeat protein n=1 Tax=Segetibacter koreensis TaxID=398037 RepID=UPI00036D0272|nr:tetratricopeptide repeat protein [Segetibacter koreensis]
MKKVTTLLLAVLLSGKLLIAQSVDDAKRSLYYGRVTSAKQALDKIVAGNAKDAQAIYWLGQTYLAMDSIGGARQVYQNALNSGVNDPLIWVGMGHVELLEGKKDAARQRFEAAVTASTKKKKEDVNILNAIGRANADGPANTGDPAYAVQLLKRAITLDPNNSDVFVNLGINYLKLGPDQGGNAYEAFNNAIKVDPKNARAKFRLGKIFQSQGNSEKFLQYYNEAIAADPAFTPVYLDLYDYYANRDVNKAREYLEKYIANSDKDCGADYLLADYLFRSGKYQESLDKAKAMSTGACANYPRLKVLFAYNYDRLGDSAQARSNIQSYLSGLTPDKMSELQTKNIGADYLFAASVLKKFQGGEDSAINYLQKALDLDTARANRVKYMDTIAFLYKKADKPKERLEWLQKSFKLNPSPSNFDMYNMADAAITAGDTALADSMSRAYIQKYPDQEYGYVLLTRAAKAADPDSSKGTAFDQVEQYITFLKTQDSVKNASKIKTQYYYIASVAADKLKDYKRSLDAINQILAIDPADTFASQAKPVLEKALNPKSSSSSSNGSGTKKTGTSTRKKKS